MSSTTGSPRGALLVGSVPLENAAEVFRNAGSILGRHLRRIPDGETGERINWIGWQFGVFNNHPALDPAPPDPDDYAPLPRVRIREGASADELRFEDLGYARAALESYPLFARMKGEGELPAHVRFQVTLPTPLAPITTFVAPESRAAIEPAYEAAMLHELDLVLNGIPHDQLAIQWDIAVEFGILEGVWPAYFDEPLEGIIERISRLSDHVPEGVELGYHLCYGDFEHQHFVQPQDASRLVEITNGISASVARSIQWIHMPVPRDRTDESYFAPLASLQLHPETELYLGLVHFTDGVAGTRQRIDAAKRVVTDFGVATECGLGRRPAEQIPDLLRIHQEVAAPVE